MENKKSNSIFILKLIGSLFSVVTVLVLAILIWMLTQTHESESGTDYNGFIIATAILNAATATIASFIWWIVSNKNRFLNFD